MLNCTWMDLELDFWFTKTSSVNEARVNNDFTTRKVKMSEEGIP